MVVEAESAENQSKKAAKKAAKDAAKSAKKAEYKAASVPAAETVEESKDYSEGKYGVTKMIQVKEQRHLKKRNQTKIKFSVRKSSLRT